MKTISLLVLIMVLSMIGQAQTNIYHPFPTSNTIWRESSGGYQSGFCADYQDFIIGDTILNGQTHIKTWRTGVTYYENSQGFCTGIISGHISNYKGAYRNDSLNKKVYFYSPALGADTLLYDFNLNLYDTLHQTALYNPNWAGVSYVTEIDSILIGPSYHKSFGISNSWSTNYVFLIEGIGSTLGLFAQIAPPFESGSLLLCVVQNGVTIYPDSTYICDLLASNPEILNQNVSFIISPNPCRGNTFVNFSPTKNNIDLLIIDLLGVEKVRASDIKNGNGLNLTNLKSGLYIYKAFQGKSIISTGKLIKTD